MCGFGTPETLLCGGHIFGAISIHILMDVVKRKREDLDRTAQKKKTSKKGDRTFFQENRKKVDFSHAPSCIDIDKIYQFLSCQKK